MSEKQTIEHLTQELQQAQENNKKLLDLAALLIKSGHTGALMGSLAHEAVQPLAATRINIYSLSSMQGNERDDATFETVLKRIDADTERAIHVISRLRAIFEEDSADKQSFSLSAVVDDVLTLAKGELRHHNIKLSADIEAGLSVVGWQGQLQMVVMNLISNAIEAVKAISSERSISVRLEADKSRLSLSVTDNGVAPVLSLDTWVDDHQEALAETKRHAGLWLMKMIIENHQGQIKTSLCEPSGTLFRVILPR